MKIDISKHKEAYLNESKDLVKSMNMALVELEKNTDNMQLLHQIFRSIHTLKSLSATMQYEQTMNLCHAMEDLFDAVRHGQLDLLVCVDLLFESIDQLSLQLKQLSSSKNEIDCAELVSKLCDLLKNQSTEPVQNGKTQMQFEIDAVEKIHAIEVKIEQLDKMMNLAEEFLVNKMKLESIREQIEHPELGSSIESLGRLITELQYYLMQVRLVPIAFVFNRFIRMARDLAKQQHKEVDLKIEGSEIELDRSLIDEIAQAISHLIRNAIDHGLETTEERKKLNKPEKGTIWLKMYRTKESAKIEISDDGAGINVDEVRQLALDKNLIHSNATDNEIIDSIFSGVSTTNTVTTVSGRGLGLSIVKLKIESIGGTIQVHSTQGVGTSFTIEIPLSLAIIKTLFVKSGAEVYAIPTEFVDRLLMVEAKDILGVMHDEGIIFEENNIPIIRLSNLFRHEPSTLEKLPIVIIRKGEARLGLVVDRLLSTKEIIIKSLNRTIRDNKYFSGATLIGSGQMILILDIVSLFRMKNKNELQSGGFANAL